MKYIERFQRSFQCLSLSVPKTLDPFRWLVDTSTESCGGLRQHPRNLLVQMDKGLDKFRKTDMDHWKRRMHGVRKPRVQALKIREHYQSQDRPASQWSWLQLFQRIVASRSMVRWWQCQFLGPEKRLESGLKRQFERRVNQIQTLGHLGVLSNKSWEDKIADFSPQESVRAKRLCTILHL